MLCDQCGKKPATVHVTRILNGVKSESHLCSDCAQAEKPAMAFDLPSLLAGMLGKNAAPARTATCPDCGMSYTRFRRSGKLGCPSCYAALRAPLEELCQKVHGASEHRGRVPEGANESEQKKHRTEELKAELRAAVEREDYETAARLRDEIRSIEGEGESR